MAIYFRHQCTECGATVVNDEKTKKYVHVEARNHGAKEPHPVPGVTVTKTDDRAA